MADDTRRYNYMENVLNKIIKNYLALSDQETKRNNEILKQILDTIIPIMKEKDNLFNQMYTNIFHGGSFYDGLRIGAPSEFDLDLLLKLPKLLNPQLTNSNKPGFVHLKLTDYIKFLNSDLAQRFKGINNLINEKTFLLETTKVLSWMEGLVKRAVDELPKENNKFVIATKHGKLFAKVCKGGPAFTLKATGTVGGKAIDLDVDLVPCFFFQKDQWPKGGYRDPLPSKSDFFIVPKPLKNEKNVDQYWRLSFQQQERVIMDNKRGLKPAIKLLKQMRDRWNHKCIASYYIKTVVLWEADGKRDAKFWNYSLSYVFMMMLKEYQKHLSNKKIPYFWNKNNNLIGGVKGDNMINMTNKIKGIIEDIEKHPEDPFVVAKYLLFPKDYEELKKNM